MHEFYKKNTKESSNFKIIFDHSHVFFLELKIKYQIPSKIYRNYYGNDFCLMLKHRFKIIKSRYERYFQKCHQESGRDPTIIVGFRLVR